jgi:hypothetical protein
VPNNRPEEHMKVEGITWHGLVLEAEHFAATRKLIIDTFGLEPMIEMEGWSLLACRTAQSSTSSHRRPPRARAREG